MAVDLPTSYTAKQQRGTTRLVVHMKNTNDRAPEFQGLHVPLIFYDTTTPPMQIGQVQAFDPDGSAVKYYFGSEGVLRASARVIRSHLHVCAFVPIFEIVPTMGIKVNIIAKSQSIRGADEFAKDFPKVSEFDHLNKFSLNTY